ncbi:uncharacterized protein LOC144099534 [Amblyomma americanum]
METMKKYGDLHTLLMAEDHIVLKLEAPWPQDSPLPEGCLLGNKCGSLLVMDHRALVSARSTLRSAGISGALFAGCVPFNSSELFESAAREVLKATEEICIVHNGNTICKLIRMFPQAKVLALPHDFVPHAVEREEPLRDHLAPLVDTCQLRELLGSIEGLSNGYLLFTQETVRAVLRTCPLVRRIDSHGVLEAFLHLADTPDQTSCPKAKDITHVMLLTSLDTCHAKLGDAPDASDVAIAASTFPHVESFMVVVKSLETMAAVSAFRHLRSLSIALRPPISFVNVDSELLRLLRALPRLECLSLEFCGGLRLAVITKLCPQIKGLRLLSCEGPSDDDIALDGNAFPDLEILEMSAKLHKRTYHGLFRATAQRLRILRLSGDGTCSEFLHLCCLGGQQISFPHVEELMLGTKLTVSALKLHPEDLHTLLKALPELRLLVTDSYDLRLFFQNYCVPRGRVSLLWCECVFCAVHDENRDRRREYIASQLPHDC